MVCRALLVEWEKGRESVVRVGLWTGSCPVGKSHCENKRMWQEALVEMWSQKMGGCQLVLM